MERKFIDGKIVHIHKYQPHIYGTWIVKGEDSNCDFSGSQHQPTLGYFEGTYMNVYEKATTLEGWETWGVGGDIDLIKITKVFKL